VRSRDARQLTQEAQEELRKRAVVLCEEQRMKQSEVARLLDVARGTVNRWVQEYRKGGEKALDKKKRGRRHGSGRKLEGWQAGTVVNIIRDKCPDQLKLPWALWTAEAVQQLIEEKFGIDIAIRTVRDYLKRWGFTPQKPLKRAYERDPVRIKRWLEEEYPAIRTRAKAEGAAILWGDEMGVRADYCAGRGYAPSGKKPILHDTGKRFGCNVISAISNLGKLNFMVFEGRFKSPLFIRFLRRLIKQSKGRKLFLILDNHTVHKSKAVREFLSKHADEIELFFLPPYAPELNPDEVLNHDVKANGVGRKTVRTPADLKRNVRGYLRSRQRRPETVRAFFRERHVRYAA